MHQSSIPPRPTEHRVESIDVLRGFAVLGILAMNIQSFAMIGAAYTNPTAFQDLTGANRAVWAVCHVLTDQKMMTIFTMLFGAGIVLMADRAVAAGAKPGKRHYLRTGWLLLFGLAHAYLFWFGDILYHYALTAMVIYPLRRLRARWLIPLGLVFLGVGSAVSIAFGLTMDQWPQEAVDGMRASWRPGDEAIAQELATYRGGWLGQLSKRAETAAFFHTMLFASMMVWRCAGGMLLGMALYKLGVFGRPGAQADSQIRPARFYRTLSLVGFGLGLPVVLYGAYRHFAHDWAMEYSFFLGGQFNYWGSLPVALGWVGVVMLAFSSGLWPGLRNAFAATGRMALTNYLTQTLICTTLFYGHGLGWFGAVDRVGQGCIIVVIWVAQLIWSPWWLARYRFGPFEWLWRSLTYWRRQPMRRRG